MAEKVIMPKADWVAGLDAIRAKGGAIGPILSGDLATSIEAITGGGEDLDFVIAEQVAKLEALEAAVNGKAGGGQLTQQIVERTVTELKGLPWTEVGHAAFSKCSDLTTVDLPLVQRVQQDGFNECRALTSVRFPQATFFGIGAFYYDDALVSVDAPNVDGIASECFYGCDKLTHITLDKVGMVASYAFLACKGLTDLVFPALWSLGDKAFRSCTNLKSLTISATSVCNLSGKLMDELPVGFAIYVPANLVDQYKAATNWVQYASVINPIPEGGAA